MVCINRIRVELNQRGYNARFNFTPLLLLTWWALSHPHLQWYTEIREMDSSRATQLFTIDLKQGRGEPLLISFSNIMIRMGSYFHHWVNYNGVTVSIELLEWGRTFSEFWCTKIILSGI